MGGDIPGVLQEMISRPKAGDRAFPLLTIGDGMEVRRVSVPLQKPILSAPLPPK